MEVKRPRKTTLIIATLSILLVAAITSTIVLAAFSAQKSAVTTINFADGLTMILNPKNPSGTGIYKIAQAGTGAATFVYGTNNQITDQTASVTLDGISATLNKSGYVVYRIELQENSAAVGGAWQGSSGGPYTFQPTGAPTTAGSDWKAVLTLPTSSGYTAAISNNIITITCGGEWASSALTKDLFVSLVFSGWNNADIIDDLAGRTFALSITIKAQTGSAPTIS